MNASQQLAERPSTALTRYILGDPAPDRWAKSEARRRQLVSAEARRAMPYVSVRVATIVRALADGPLSLAALGSAMGVKESTTRDRMLCATTSGTVVRDTRAPRPGRYALTDFGRRVLAEIGR